MNIEEIKQIFSSNQTNVNLVRILNEDSLGIVADVLANVPASDFVELNPNASLEEKQQMFSLLDVPVPIDSLSKENIGKGGSFSQEVNNEMKQLLNAINKEGTNVEYPCALYGSNNEYQHMHKMYKEDDVENLGRQAVVYDSNWVSKFVAENDNCNLALMHTHPAPLGKEHNTLFTKYKEKLAQLGIKPDGLNLSLADVNTQLVVDNAIKNMGKNVSLESVVLMHDGTLISFTTNNGLTLTHESKLERQKEENENVGFNEYGEILRSDQENVINENLEIPIFTPPEPKIEPVNIEEIKPIQAEMFPETYGTKKVDIVKHTPSQSLESENNMSKEV